eukprot:1586288-Pyramimonas_sp.AAC.1
MDSHGWSRDGFTREVEVDSPLSMADHTKEIAALKEQRDALRADLLVLTPPKEVSKSDDAP